MFTQKPLSQKESFRRQRTKILLYSLDFGAMGGIERYLLNLAEGLQADGRFEVAIACSAGTPFYRQLEDAGFTVYGIHTAGIFVRHALRMLDPLTPFQITRILDEYRPHLVHLQSGQAENLFIKTLLGYPLVMTFHGYGPVYNLSATSHPVSRWLKRYLMRPLFWYFVSQLDALLLVSRAERQRLLDEGYLENGKTGQVVHNGVILENFRRDIPETELETFRQAWRLPVHTRCVSFINRLDANKDPMAFIALAEKLAQRPEYQDVYFLLAGDGPLQQAVQERVAQSPARLRFRLLGYSDTVSTLLAASELVVSTSHDEGFGLGVVEAMAAGTPCLAYAVGGIPEILNFPEAAPLLVLSGDTDVLLQQAMSLLNLPRSEYNALAAVLKTQAERFDQAAFLKKMIAVYEQVLAK